MDATVLSESLARAYRTGALSLVKAGVLVPLVIADSLGRFVDDWVACAGRVTVRRLRENVEWALTLQETDPEAYWQGAGLPPELREARERRNAETERGAGTDREIGAPRRNREGGLQPAGRGGSEATSEHDGGADREIRAPHRDREGHIAEVQPGIGAVASGNPETDREIGAPPGKRRGHLAHDETCSVRFIGPADIVQLFKAVVCTVRRSLERDTGRLPTPGEAVGVMLDHALSSWDSPNGKVAARHKVFARDGWRCATPGCSSMRNLHDHHIRFRSAGGSDELENRVTLCAFHHLRGVHAELLRCVGRAPDGITWQMGIRPGVTPLLAYRSGDLRIPAMQA